MVRQPTYDEETEVLSFFEAAEKGLAKKVLGDRALAVHDAEEGRVVSLVPPGLWDHDEDLWALAAGGGLPLGVLDEDGFGLDLQGAIVWARETRAQVVRCSEQATRMFLYGKNVLGDSVEGFDRKLKLGDACVVANVRGEGIGIGEVVGRFKGQSEAVAPLHDLGAYLRDQSR